MMQELLLALAQGLVEDKAAVRVTEDEPNEEGVIVYHLTVAEDDMGRVIGKQGRIAKAIRVVMRAAAVRENKKVMVEIDD
jgi:KH domain protein